MIAVTQSTKGKMNPLTGFLAIFLSVASLFIMNGVLVWLKDIGKLSDLAASILIFAYALALFLLLLYRFSLSCVYTLDSMKIRFSRVYIKNPRLSEQIMLREVAFFGPVGDAERFEYRRTQRFTARRGEIETKALIYKREGKLLRVLFSPNEELSNALREALKNK